MSHVQDRLLAVSKRAAIAQSSFCKRFKKLGIGKHIGGVNFGEIMVGSEIWGTKHGEQTTKHNLGDEASAFGPFGTTESGVQNIGRELLATTFQPQNSGNIIWIVHLGERILDVQN